MQCLNFGKLIAGLIFLIFFTAMLPIGGRVVWQVGSTVLMIYWFLSFMHLVSCDENAVKSN